MNGRWVVPVVTILTVGITIVVFSLFSVTGWLCWRHKVAADAAVASETAPPPVVVSKDENPAMARDRSHMIERHLRARGIDDEGVLKVMGQLRRQDFVADAYQEVAYADRPLPIGHEQTISQPFIVALMTQLARVKPESRVLDIGTGSGYQAAVLAGLCKEVYSIEIVKALADESRQRLERLGYKNVVVRHGDGYRGWPEHAPFDAIIVAAAPDHVPEPLVEQLAPGGRLVIPVGRFFQELLLVEKDLEGVVRHRVVTGVAFVPMTGEAEKVERP